MKMGVNGIANREQKLLQENEYLQKKRLDSLVWSYSLVWLQIQKNISTNGIRT